MDESVCVCVCVSVCLCVCVYDILSDERESLCMGERVDGNIRTGMKGKEKGGSKRVNQLMSGRGRD